MILTFIPAFFLVFMTVGIPGIRGDDRSAVVTTLPMETFERCTTAADSIRRSFGEHVVSIDCTPTGSTSTGSASSVKAP